MSHPRMASRMPAAGPLRGPAGRPPEEASVELAACARSFSAWPSRPLRPNHRSRRGPGQDAWHHLAGDQDRRVAGAVSLLVSREHQW
jgi:hypothetical protein